MTKIKCSLCACLLLLAGTFQAGCSSHNYSREVLNPMAPPTMAVISGDHGPDAYYKGQKVSSLQAEAPTAGLVVQDGRGGIVVLEGQKPTPQDPNYVNARELKLKVRELAEQLIADVTDPYLRSAVALPSAFVDLNNMHRTSAFGRLFSEQLIYEFNQRGFPVREYRIPDSITVVDSVGEFYLTRLVENVKVQAPGAVVIAGTYHADNQAIFVNARLVRPNDGRVLRTANLVIPNNGLNKRLLKPTLVTTLAASSIEIKNCGTGPAAVLPRSSIDMGADIH